jgi:dTDP-4-dehydrorhamnose 3,5-epimerase
MDFAMMDSRTLPIASDNTRFFPRIQATAQRREDLRGWLQVLYESDASVLKRSFSVKGAFRGLHWQDATAPQVKVIRVVTGAIIDFVVDMNDPTRTIHHDKIVPEDGWVRIDAHLAHGLYALEETLFEYFCDGGYDEGSELTFAITEHIKAVLGVDTVILSPKDLASPPLHPVRTDQTD